MATDLVPVTSLPSGVNSTLAAVDGTNGNSFPNNRTTLLLVRNGSGGSINVTVAPVLTSRPADGQFPAVTVASIVKAVPAGETHDFGPFPSCFNVANGKVTATFSSGTSVTAAAIQL